MGAIHHAGLAEKSDVMHLTDPLTPVLLLLCTALYIHNLFLVLGCIGEEEVHHYLE